MRKNNLTKTINGLNLKISDKGLRSINYRFSYYESRKTHQYLSLLNYTEQSNY
jgi:hypothetical protein